MAAIAPLKNIGIPNLRPVMILVRVGCGSKLKLCSSVPVFLAAYWAAGLICSTTGLSIVFISTSRYGFSSPKRLSRLCVVFTARRPAAWPEASPP